MDDTTRQDDTRWRSVTYDAPETNPNVDDVHSAIPTSDPNSAVGQRITPDEGGERHGASRTPSRDSRHRARRASVADEERYTFPDGWTNLDELAATSPVENVTDARIYRHRSLEETRGDDQAYRRDEQRRASLPPGTAAGPAEAEEKPEEARVSKLLTEVYTLSYLVFFSFLGTLARVGLTALTNYPDAPIIFSTVWANFGGSLVMGFLAEDRMLFRHELGTPTYDQQLARAKRDDEETGSGSGVDLAAAKRAHVATKKTIPLYIGLAIGFCGSFTSFSAFVRDIFLALSNDLVAPGFGPTAVSRNGGYSFMAMLAVITTTVSLALSGLFLGAHLAIASERLTPSIPYPITRKVLDPLAIFLGWGCWLGAVLLSIFPPNDDWRGRATFSLVFAPLGCLLRFYLAVRLNGMVASFPLGTFAANVFGTAVLGMAWDIANVPIGGIVGCQVLQGVEDGFCGCLTTISTWAVELSSLRRRSAYIYGTASVVVSLALMIAIMGGLRWTDGFSALKCR
ncbi:membrane protein [Tolypocladium ophioglossoides CBS 100239]|uniref:Membrane protein n=1 Tax=Tolypocladium ophioglossoides (strain CBS 100239) TaxID=1163406 RepID=A0A0L0N4K9_TOLOC|nr:membrane protein [Tolypocladium ophioglossoides CBS 100239]